MADYATMRKAAEAVEFKNELVKQADVMDYGIVPGQTGSKDVKVEAKPHKESTTEQEVTIKATKDEPTGDAKNPPPDLVAAQSTTVTVKTAASRERLQEVVDLANRLFSRG